MEALKKCECGCNQIVNLGKRFIYRHNLKVLSKDSERKRIESLTGRKHSEETKKKISEAMMGHEVSEVSKRKMAEGNKGKIISIKTRLNMSKGQKGRKFSEIHKKKLSKSMIGNQYAKGLVHSKEAKEKISKANLGKKLSEETKQKISIAQIGKKKKEKSCKTCKIYCDAWLDKDYKQSIRDHDNNKCQNPNCKGNCNHLYLVVHHIDYNKLNCHPSNLITLCASCHSKTNGNRKHWIKFYQNIMKTKGV